MLYEVAFHRHADQGSKQSLARNSFSLLDNPCCRCNRCFKKELYTSAAITVTGSGEFQIPRLSGELARMTWIDLDLIQRLRTVELQEPARAWFESCQLV